MDALEIWRREGLGIGLLALLTVAGGCSGGRRQAPDGGTGGTGGAAGVDGGSGEETASADDAPAADTGEETAAADATSEAGGEVAVTDAAGTPLTRVGGFAAGRGGLCGLGYDTTAGMVWVYPCSNASLFGHLPDGTAMVTLDEPGESANDGDVDVAPGNLMLGTTAVPAGSVLFVNGETDVADVYALDQGAMTVRGMLATMFGNSHTVGASYHAARASIFAVQDKVPGNTIGNMIAEIDPITGAVKNMFSTLPNFSVNYGDVDVCQATGNLFVVSDDEDAIGEFTPAGVFVRAHPLPGDVSGLSGIGMDDATGDAWVGARSGVVSRLQGLPCM